jgi:long-chain acyl-CoA synthetase
VTLWDLFETTARQVGDRVAVEVQKKDALDRFTYRELHALALDRAAELEATGVTPGDRCAILAHNDADWCAAYLGILARGAIVVPLDTNYSAAQVATVLSDSRARVLFVNTRLTPTAREATSALPDVAVLDIHNTSTRHPGTSGTPHPGTFGTPAPGTPHPGTPHPGASGTLAPGTLVPACTDPAVILYTSGTTADPKGVVLSHANLIAERDAAFAVVDVSETDSVLGVLPLFHSLAQLANLLLPFAVGARVVYLETLNSQELVRALSERQITIFACVPQFFYLIHERVMREIAMRGIAARAIFRGLLAVAFSARRLGINPGPWLFARVHRTLGRQMRLFVTGGSKFDPAIGRDFYALGFTILQAYGLTETSGAATISRPDEAHIDTVGRPLPGIELEILPPESADADGEIAIRGPIVMQGYYDRPDATAAVMRDGWFLTGDLGRLDAAGRLTITGRKKEVIILANGKNIYPEEVEAHYRQSAYVQEICVTTVALGDRPAAEHLYAVVVPDMDVLRARKMVNAGEILRFEIEGLGASLPSYKRLLGYEVSFEPLPRTTTGKLKRHEIERRLRERKRAGDAAAGAGFGRPDDRQPAPDVVWPDEPHVPAALAIAKARAAPGSVLSPDANLELDLGLDSMQRVELMTELEQRFGVRVPDERTPEIFTLGHLVDAVRPGAAAPAPAGSPAAPTGVGSDESWRVILDDLPPADDPVLSGLLERRPFLVPLLFAASRVLTRLMARVEASGVEHLPREGAFIISPNHQSYLDPFFVAGVLPRRVFVSLFFVGAIEYFETPLMAWVARQVNCVPVDPDSNLVPAMKAGAFGLKHGKVLMLFPEGERSIDGTVKRFKKGSPILSRHMGVPVVPVALRGVYEIWPRGRGFNWRTLVPWRRERVRVAFGAPMPFTAEESSSDAAVRLREAVDVMWKEL